MRSRIYAVEAKDFLFPSMAWARLVPISRWLFLTHYTVPAAYCQRKIDGKGVPVSDTCVSLDRLADRQICRPQLTLSQTWYHKPPRPAPPPPSTHPSTYQGAKTMINTLHYCFVRVDRGSGAFPAEDKEGTPWFVLKDRLLRVRETRPDDPEAELMVSFLLGCGTILSAKAAQVELELRLQVRWCYLRRIDRTISTLTCLFVFPASRISLSLACLSLFGSGGGGLIRLGFGGRMRRVCLLTYIRRERLLEAE